jgi:hypothetical protein
LDNIVDVITSFTATTAGSEFDTADSMALILPFMIELHSIKKLLVPTTMTTTKDTGYERDSETQTSMMRKDTLYGFNLWLYHISAESLLSFSYLSHLSPDSEEIVVTVAYYSLAWILISNHANATNNNNENEKSDTNLAAVIQAHCSSILTAAAYMDNCEDGCSYIRMILPLRLVADLMASDRVQRESALYRLELWRRDKGFKGNLTLSGSIQIL